MKLGDEPIIWASFVGVICCEKKRGSTRYDPAFLRIARSPLKNSPLLVLIYHTSPFLLSPFHTSHNKEPPVMDAGAEDFASTQISTGV